MKISLWDAGYLLMCYWPERPQRHPNQCRSLPLFFASHYNQISSYCWRHPRLWLKNTGHREVNLELTEERPPSWLGVVVLVVQWKLPQEKSHQWFYPMLGPHIVHCTLQDVSSSTIVAILFMGLTTLLLDWIWGLLHNREFTPSTVNMSKTMVRDVTGSRGEHFDVLLINDHVAELPSKYL